MSQVSKYISLNEILKSNTATRRGIDNTNITESQLNNFKELGKKVFDPLREWVGGPVKINSGFRSPELNEAIGGAGGLNGKSQHCANNGAALDIDDTFGHKTNAEMFEYIKNNLPYDQLLWEYGDDDNPDWVHVSHVSIEANRKQVLRVKRVDGKVKYIFM
jgi:hypothetical protein